MKRSAAIIGPTPSFVRWAIAKPCQFRELDLESLPDSTFRQLRAIKALSDGIAEGRIFEGICVHSSVTSESNAPKTARGFPVEEVFNVFGAKSELDRTCGTCPANACGVNKPMWAGCSGWLPAASEWNLQTASRSSVDTPPPKENLPEFFENSIKQREDSYQGAFENHQNAWYGLWQTGVLSARQVKVLIRVLEDVSLSTEIVSPPLLHLLDASRKCMTSNLELHVELIPPGISDGSDWTIAAHCPNCRAVPTSVSKTCDGCGRVGNTVEERKVKVLGYHPYLLLKHLWGIEETTAFVDRYNRVANS